VAARCRAAMRAARNAVGGEVPPRSVAIALEEADFTDEQWVLICPLLPPQRGDGQTARRAPRRLGRHPVGGEDESVVAGDARGVWQMGEPTGAMSCG
jgi:hypothetical protein